MFMFKILISMLVDNQYCHKRKKQNIIRKLSKDKMPRLNETLRNQAIGMLAVGIAKREVARRLNCHVSTISRLSTRYQQTGNVKDRPRPGRPKVTTRIQDRHIRIAHLRNRFLPATETAQQTRGTHGYVTLSHVLKF
ncbi:MAG: helix-turn-helix domain-containing protein [Candidatus Thiodiazotropha taylori]